VWTTLAGVWPIFYACIEEPLPLSRPACTIYISLLRKCPRGTFFLMLGVWTTLAGIWPIYYAYIEGPLHYRGLLAPFIDAEAAAENWCTETHIGLPCASPLFPRSRTPSDTWRVCSFLTRIVRKQAMYFKVCKIIPSSRTAAGPEKAAAPIPKLWARSASDRSLEGNHCWDPLTSHRCPSGNIPNWGGQLMDNRWLPSKKSAAERALINWQTP
jgi:hypothetical protein